MDLDPRYRYDLLAVRGETTCSDVGLTANDAETYRDILRSQGYTVTVSVHKFQTAAA
jgi:hypothetical protein